MQPKAGSFLGRKREHPGREEARESSLAVPLAWNNPWRAVGLCWGEGGPLPAPPHQLPAMLIASAAALRIFPGLILLSHRSDLVLTFERASKALACVKWFSCRQRPYCLTAVRKRPDTAVLDNPGDAQACGGAARSGCFASAVPRNHGHPPQPFGRLPPSVLLLSFSATWSGPVFLTGHQMTANFPSGRPDVRAHLNPQACRCVQASEVRREIEGTHMHIQS